MEIHELASRALFGRTLEDKLIRPERLTDAAPGAPLRSSVAWPGRPSELDLSRWRNGAKVAFPAPKELATPRGRGLALHFFANHELLAIELMALALLRFPDAPPAFRRGVVSTLLEEQDHMALYRARMTELGVAFGEAPVNDFFWSFLSRMESPLDFVVGMGLTFEQANLDFARHYATLFAEAGDAQTAALLKQVYDDEVGHVRHGLAWFREWKGEGSDWECYVEALPEGLAPSRAKGRPYSTEARREAGFDATWIESLALCSRSKGRPPRIWMFHPTVEMEWETARRVPPTSCQPSAGLHALVRDFAGLPQFLAAHDDVVVVPRLPTPAFLCDLAACGFDTPEFVLQADVGSAAFRSRKLGRVVPWGWSESFARAHAPLVKACLFPSHDASRVAPLLADKSAVGAFEEGLLASGEVEGLASLVDVAFHGARAVTSFDGIEAAIAARPEVDRWVLKAPLSSSGRERVFLPGAGANAHAAPRDERPFVWARRSLARHGTLALEPWLRRLADLSVQVTVEPDAEGGRHVVHGVTRFLCDEAGRYVGTLLGRRGAGLPPAVLRYLHRNPSGRGVVGLLEDLGAAVARRAAAAGYVGALGVDTFLYAHPERGFALRPVVEINPRYTMGRLALSLGARVAPGITAVWMHLGARDWEGSALEFALRARSVMGFETTPGPGPLFKGGFLATTDPATAERTLAILVGGTTTRDLLDRAQAVSSAFGKRVAAFLPH